MINTTTKYLSALTLTLLVLLSLSTPITTTQKPMELRIGDYFNYRVKVSVEYGEQSSKSYIFRTGRVETISSNYTEKTCDYQVMYRYIVSSINDNEVEFSWNHSIERSMCIEEKKLENTTYTTTLTPTGDEYVGELNPFGGLNTSNIELKTFIGSFSELYTYLTNNYRYHILTLILSGQKILKLRSMEDFVDFISSASFEYGFTPIVIDPTITNTYDGSGIQAEFKQKTSLSLMEIKAVFDDLTLSYVKGILVRVSYTLRITTDFETRTGEVRYTVLDKTNTTTIFKLSMDLVDSSVGEASGGGGGLFDFSGDIYSLFMNPYMILFIVVVVIGIVAILYYQRSVRWE